MFDFFLEFEEFDILPDFLDVLCGKVLRALHRMVRALVRQRFSDETQQVIERDIEEFGNFDLSRIIWDTAATFIR